MPVLADPDQLPRVRLDRRGHPDPARQPVADPSPDAVDPLALQQRAQQMHTVIGQHGDEQVRPDAVLLHVPARPQADLALLAAEGRIYLDRPPVGFREAEHLRIGMPRAQHVRARPRVAGRVLRHAFPAHRLRPQLGLGLRFVRIPTDHEHCSRSPEYAPRPNAGVSSAWGAVTNHLSAGSCGGRTAVQWRMAREPER